MLVRIKLNFNHDDLKDISVENEIEDITVDNFQTFKTSAIIKAGEIDIPFKDAILELSEFDDFFVSIKADLNPISEYVIKYDATKRLEGKYEEQIDSLNKLYEKYKKTYWSEFSWLYPTIKKEYEKMSDVWYYKYELYSAYIPGYKEECEHEVKMLTKLYETEYKLKYHNAKTWFEENGWEVF